MISNLFTNSSAAAQEQTLTKELFYFLFEKKPALPVYQFILLAMLLLFLGIILSRVLRRLDFKKLLNTNAAVQTKVHYLAEHHIEISAVDPRQSSSVRKTIFKRTADKYEVGEITRTLGNLNGLTIRCCARNLNQDIVVDKIVRIEINSLFPRSLDVLHLHLSGKETGTISSYRSMIPENKSEAKTDHDAEKNI